MAVTETVKIVFEVDDKQVTDSVAELAKLGKVSQEDAAKFKQLGDASKAAGAGLGQAAAGADKLNDSLKKTNETFKPTKEWPVLVKATGDSAKAAADGFVPLRTRLAEAKLELEQLSDEFGPFSAEATAARQRAGDLADEFQDLNRQVNLLNPQGKVQAFQKLGQGIVGTFSIATGALQAFGAENEQVQAIAQKLQGALNIAQGIQSIVDLKEAYDDVKTVLGFTTAAQTTLTTATNAGSAATAGASTAMKGFAASLSATGIGAIVVALGALAGALILSSDETDDAVESTDEYKKSLSDLEKAQKDATVAELRLAQSRAKTPEEKERIERQITAIENQFTLNELKAKEAKINEEIVAKQKKLLVGGITNFFTDTEKDLEGLKAKSENLQKEIEAKGKELTAKETQRQENQSDEINKDKDRKRKEDADKAKKNAEEIEAARLKAFQDNQALIDQANASAEGLRQQFEQELQRQLSDIDKAGQSERLLNQLTYFGDSEALAEANLESEIRQQEEKIQKLKDFQQQDTEAYKNALIQKDLLDKQYARTKEQNDQKALDEARAAALIQNQLSATSAEDLLARNNKTQEKYLKDSIEIYKEGTKERKAAEDALALYLKGLRENDVADAKKSEKEKADAQLQRIDKAFTLANEATDIFIQENQRQNEEELASLEQAREQGLISEEAYQVKLKQIKRKSAEDAKKAQVFQATMNAAQAILSALATFYPDPASKTAAVAFAAALGALNLAKVIATPIPKFKQGTLAVPGYDTGDDSVMAMLRPGEAVIPTETNREYSAIIRSIYKREIPASEFNEFLANRNQPVFDFNKVTLDALFKRDIRTTALNSAVVKRTGGDMPTIKVKADVDTQQLSRAMAKNKAVELSNSQVLAKALAQEIAKTHNPRRQ